MFPQDNLLQDGASNPENYEGLDQIWRRVILTQHLWDPIRKSITDLSKNVIYRGVGFEVDPQNEFAFPILKGSHSTYNSKGEIELTSTNINLVAGYQSRFNSRFLFSGSLDMCSDFFIGLSVRYNETYLDSSNYQICMNIADWTFQQKAVLRYSNLEHKLDDPALIAKGQNFHDYKEGDAVHF